MIYLLTPINILPLNSKITITRETNTTLIYTDRGDTIYKIPSRQQSDLPTNASLLRTIHKDSKKHFLSIHLPQSNTINLYNIPEDTLLNTLTLPDPTLVPICVTEDKILCKFGFGITDLYILNFSGSVDYTIPQSSIPYCYTHTHTKDYFIFKDKIGVYDRYHQQYQTYLLPFWITNATITHILTEPYAICLVNNGRILLINLWKLPQKIAGKRSVYPYVSMGWQSFDVWASEDEMILTIISNRCREQQTLYFNDFVYDL